MGDSVLALTVMVFLIASLFASSIIWRIGVHLQTDESFLTSTDVIWGMTIFVVSGISYTLFTMNLLDFWYLLVSIGVTASVIFGSQATISALVQREEKTRRAM